MKSSQLPQHHELKSFRLSTHFKASFSWLAPQWKKSQSARIRLSFANFAINCTNALVNNSFQEFQESGNSLRRQRYSPSSEFRHKRGRTTFQHAAVEIIAWVLIALVGLSNLQPSRRSA
jgi:hypothetical protein